MNDITEWSIIVSKKTTAGALHRPCETGIWQKGHFQARMKYSKNNMEKQGAYDPENTVPTVGVSHCGDASVHLELEILSRWKEWLRKTDM